MKVKLGVHDVAYSDPEERGATTTYEVAEILEAKYGVMAVFEQLHMDLIQDAVVDHMMGMIRSVVQGNPRALEQVRKRGIPLDKVESAFRDYLEADEWQRQTGKEIAAAVAGISHRFKTPGGKLVAAKAVDAGKGGTIEKVMSRSREPRPAFVDTGLYSAAFRAWLE